MIDFLIFLVGAGAGRWAALAIASAGKDDRERDAYEQGKMDGFYEGMSMRRDVIDETKCDK